LAKSRPAPHHRCAPGVGAGGPPQRPGNRAGVVLAAMPSHQFGQRIDLGGERGAAGIGSALS
jgi:hypothetical protein